MGNVKKLKIDKLTVSPKSNKKIIKKITSTTIEKKQFQIKNVLKLSLIILGIISFIFLIYAFLNWYVIDKLKYKTSKDILFSLFNTVTPTLIHIDTPIPVKHINTPTPTITPTPHYYKPVVIDNFKYSLVSINFKGVTKEGSKVYSGVFTIENLGKTESYPYIKKIVRDGKGREYNIDNLYEWMSSFGPNIPKNFNFDFEIANDSVNLKLILSEQYAFNKKEQVIDLGF